MAVLLDDQLDNAGQLNVEDEAARVTPATDNELLSQFIHDRRQEAFTELVDRHAAMVLAVCQRVLCDRHEAEDVFQATFLILARGARQIQRRRRASLAAWLHKVAYRAALRTAQAKHRKGKPLVDDAQSAECEQWLSIAQQEEQLMLHEELNKLPDLYRDAVVVCCLEGKSRSEAAGQLASTPEAVQKRVVRGKQLLRKRLVRRGVTAGVALTAAAIPVTSKAAALPSLVSLTSDVCTATVLNADKTIYYTNVGRIAQQGELAMRTLATSLVLATTGALVIGTLAIGAAYSGSSAPHQKDSTAIAADQEQEQARDQLDSAPVVQLAFAGALEQEANEQNNSDQNTAEQNATEQEAKLREILSRQKGDQLKVYLRGSRSKFVNGKSISDRQLKAIIDQAGLKHAIITADLGVHPNRVTEVKEFLTKAGVEKVESKVPVLTLSEVAKASREQATLEREAKLREVLSRQKGDQLKVYMNSRGTYVNGKSVSGDELKEIIRASELEQAVLTAEPDVVRERVVGVEELIRSSGIDDIQLSKPQAQP